MQMIVYPIRLSFIHPQVVPNLYDFHSTVDGLILWKSMGSINRLVTHIYQNIFYCNMCYYEHYIYIYSFS